MNNLIDRTNYNSRYLEYETFAKKILNYTCVPYQIEIQPGREKGEALCWMSCPYCYGGNAKNSGDKFFGFPIGTLSWCTKVSKMLMKNTLQ